MVGLMDLKRASVDVNLQGVTVTMNAISLAGIATLLAKHGIVRKLFRGETITMDKDLTPDAIIGFFPDLVADLIACGADKPGDPDYVAQAARLPLGDQAALLEGVVEATLSEGIGPFVARVERLLAVVSGSGTGIKAPDTK
jgi:hypothetical protein